MTRIVFASGNTAKLGELREFFADSSIELVAQRDFGIADADETGSTFVENALIKARNATRSAGLPALADDSGLLVDALNGAPGLKSARYAGAGADANANIAKLLHALKDVPEAQRSARFYCVLVYLRHARDPAPLVCQGWWEGRILNAARGGHGFGYDPIFFDPGSGLSAAEIDPGLKNRVSHRGKALAELKTRLKLT